MNKLKQNRATSFAVIILIYVLASAVGIAVYNRLTYDWQINLFIADATATVLTFAFSVIFNNASVYDPYWSVQPVVIITSFAIGSRLTPLRSLLLFAIILWGVRLTLNWAYTFKDLTHQDWRYTMLKEKTGAFYQFVNFTGIHMVPTIIVYGCTLPAAYAFVYDGGFNAVSIIFFGLSVCAVMMQGISDCQMHRFRKQKTGVFIRDGLWRTSRHPNYLGEILMWWGVALSVISVFPHRWYLALGALANTLLFLTVSIPMADGRQSLKPGYEEYKNQTRMLLPISK